MITEVVRSLDGWDRFQEGLLATKRVVGRYNGRIRWWDRVVEVCRIWFRFTVLENGCGWISSPFSLPQFGYAEQYGINLCGLSCGVGLGYVIG